MGNGIDLNSCFGCGVCIIACQSENNIPVIGKREVMRGREMLVRTDRYYLDDRNPRRSSAFFVCTANWRPVSSMPSCCNNSQRRRYESNDLQRCGTRYCANNCPFKVRRFNFFNYPKEYLTTGEDPDIIQMAMNPEVTGSF